MSELENYEAMVLSCIDPRFQELVHKETVKKGLTNKYSACTIAGACIGVVAPTFKKWHQTFWENLDISVQLHNIKKVIVINHRDCGGAVAAYGQEKFTNKEIETETHKSALIEFKKQLKIKHPELEAELYLMDLDGSVISFS